MNITPALLESDFESIQQKATLFAGITPIIQIDICDGVFVVSTTWPYTVGDNWKTSIEALHSLKDISILYELDLMIQNPETTLPLWMLTNPRRIVIHIDSTSDFSRCCSVLRGYQLEYPKFTYGIAISINSDLSQLRKYIKMVDFIQIMGIATIGIQHSEFDSRVCDLIQSVSTMDKEIPIHIDGGMNAQSIPGCFAVGASEFIVGSAIFSAQDPQLAFEKLQQL